MKRIDYKQFTRDLTIWLGYHIADGKKPDDLILALMSDLAAFYEDDPSHDYVICGTELRIMKGEPPL